MKQKFWIYETVGYGVFLRSKQLESTKEYQLIGITELEVEPAIVEKPFPKLMKHKSGPLVVLFEKHGYGCVIIADSVHKVGQYHDSFIDEVFTDCALEVKK